MALLNWADLWLPAFVWQRCWGALHEFQRKQEWEKRYKLEGKCSGDLCLLHLLKLSRYLIQNPASCFCFFAPALPPKPNQRCSPDSGSSECICWEYLHVFFSLSMRHLNFRLMNLFFPLSTLMILFFFVPLSSLAWLVAPNSMGCRPSKLHTHISKPTRDGKS